MDGRFRWRRAYSEITLLRADPLHHRIGDELLGDRVAGRKVVRRNSTMSQLRCDEEEKREEGGLARGSPRRNTNRTVRRLETRD